MPPLILCEKTSRWAIAFSVAAGRRPLPLVETRSLVQCEAALGESPAALVAVEATPVNLAALIELALRIAERYPRARWAGLLSPETAAAASLLREAGAIEVLENTLAAPRLVRLARRHAARVPQPPLGVRESVWGRLPWQPATRRG
jgi:hypothetical protein